SESCPLREPLKAICVAIAALKAGLECSFTTRKLRVFACFCLALAASPTLSEAPYCGRAGGRAATTQDTAGRRRAAKRRACIGAGMAARIAGQFVQGFSMHDPHSERMSASETRAASGLALVFAFRMLGMFMVLPVLATYGMDYVGATPALIGLAIGAY